MQKNTSNTYNRPNPQDEKSDPVSFASQTVEEPQSGIRLDKYLHEHFPNVVSRALAQKWIENHLVFCNQKQARSSYKVATGDIIEVALSAFLQPQAGDAGLDPNYPFPLEILHEDEDLLVIIKPVGLVVHPGSGTTEPTLVEHLLNYCKTSLPTLGGPERAGIVHRLDKDTSGVMVIAKSQLALTKLSQDFARHKHKRQYLALCYNGPTIENDQMEDFIHRDPKHRTRFKVSNDPNLGKWCKLSYNVIQRFPKFGCNLVECNLFTGRTHQIRVQFHARHWGLVGDKTYLSPLPKIFSLRWKKIPNPPLRQMLHAHVLEFHHPRTQELVRFLAPLPHDFENLIQSLNSSED